MGRKTKLQPEIEQKICQVIAAGNYAVTAYKSVGVRERTFYDWLKRGQDDDAVDEEVDPERHNSIYANFYRRVKVAEAEREQRLCVLISKHAEEDWRAAAHMLAVFHPEKYSQKHTVRHEGNVQHGHDHNLTLNLEALSVDELRTLQRLVGKARPAGDREGTGEEVIPGLHVVSVPRIPDQLAPPSGRDET